MDLNIQRSEVTHFDRYQLLHIWGKNYFFIFNLTQVLLGYHRHVKHKECLHVPHLWAKTGQNRFWPTNVARVNLFQSKKTKHTQVLSHKSHVTLVSQWYHSEPSRDSKRIVSPAPSPTPPHQPHPSPRPDPTPSPPPAGKLPPPDARWTQLAGQGMK